MAFQDISFSLMLVCGESDSKLYQTFIFCKIKQQNPYYLELSKSLPVKYVVRYLYTDELTA